MTRGELYRYKVSALNFNGEGPPSDEMQTRACVSPSVMTAPARVSSTSTQLSLSWTQPSSDGGCPITSYAVYRNDGSSPSAVINTEVNSASDSNVRNKPTLRSLLITNYPANSVGKTFTYQVKVWNAVGSSLSDTAKYILAGIPSTPTTGPVDDTAITSST